MDWRRLPGGADLKGARDLDWALLARQARQDARARFGEVPDLEDLVQEALVLLIERQEEIEKPRAWVRTTVWRLLANRRRASHPISPSPAELAEAVEATEPHQGLEFRLDLLSAARHLASADRRLLVFLVQGLSHREIAARLGIGWKSVGARVQGLRRRLGVRLEKSPRRR